MGARVCTGLISKLSLANEERLQVIVMRVADRLDDFIISGLRPEFQSTIGRDLWRAL